ncbi:MAG: hypothetical protein KDJ35_04150 [Alphaproteobacteria bacterium]|nr:hypothetical protein [Alphaproteobacteria bacterium]
MINKSLLTALLCVSSAGLLGACEPVVLWGSAASANYVLNQDVENLKARNYAAADYMIKQADNFIGKSDLIKAVPLHDSLEPALTSAVGQIIPQQIGTRLAQLGYRVDLSDVTRQGDGFYMAPAAKAGETARYVLAGTYARHDRELLRLKKDLTVNLRITDMQTGRVLSAFDYTIEMSGEVDEFSEAKPVITRTTQQP